MCVKYPLLKSIRCNVLPCASTGIATEFLYEGTTVHRRFGLGIDVEQDAKIMVDVESPRAQVLAAADVIIMDEISSTHSKIVDYVDRLLSAVTPRFGNLPFSGKVTLSVTL